MPEYDTKKIFAKNLNRILSSQGVRQYELAKYLNVSISAVSAWCSGDKMPRMDKIEKIAYFFGIPKSELLEDKYTNLPSNMEPMRSLKQVPLVGEIACGLPILAQQNVTDYVDLPEHIRADFALKCRGESMIDAGIHSGDIVYIRQQSQVENGQIAAIMIDDTESEATLKRFFLHNDTIILIPENKSESPLSYSGSEMARVHILGRAVGFTHMFTE